jgi:class 3 adenylate cyclase
MRVSTLDSRLDLLQDIMRDSDAAKRWHTLITNAPDEELFPIDAFELAGRWSLDLRELMTEMIHATKAGILVLNWEVICSLCGAANTHNRLGTICSTEVCVKCGGISHVVLDQTIEVTFSLHPSIRSFASSTIEPHSKRRRKVTGLDCALLPAFRKFFATDLLSPDESLQVMNVAILFTDIKGSTPLYERYGDARAYRAVREHFEMLFAAVLRSEGTIIKTIGDAVMASFTDPVKAMCAALSAQGAFENFCPLLPDSGEAIVVKLGIHQGPCIAVTLNERIDLFGGTVNIAARAQQQAGGGEVIITEAMYRDPRVRDLLAKGNREYRQLQTELRGLSGEFKLYQITALTN